MIRLARTGHWQPGPGPGSVGTVPKLNPGPDHHSVLASGRSLSLSLGYYPGTASGNLNLRLDRAKRVHRHWHGPESRETSRVQGST
eukprot:1216559-Rhodomonas_salina.1